MLETLRYEEELKAAEDFFGDLRAAKADEEEIELARELNKRKSGKFDLGKFKDHYQVALRELIDARIKGKTPKLETRPEGGAQIINLIDALKRSVAGKEKSRAAEKPQRKRAARR